MATIRRIYIFVVCLISLQWAAISINALLGAILRWLFTGQTSDLRAAVFPLAVVIVGTPVYLGHWLWAEWSARRDPFERGCLERHLYLYLTQSLLTAYLAFSIYSGVEALLEVLLPTKLTQISSQSDALAAFIGSFLAVAILGALWGYHRLVIARDEKADVRPAAERPAWIKFFSNLGFAGLGMALIAFGVFMILYELLRLPDERALSELSLAAGTLAAGSALWTYHQWMLMRDPSAISHFKLSLRWLYALCFSFVGWGLVVGGLVSAQQWFFAWWQNSADTNLPVGLAALITGLPLVAYHEWTLSRTPAKSELKGWRQLYAVVVNFAGLIMAIVGLLNGLHWLLSLLGGSRAPIADAAWLVPGLLTWAYYEFEMYPLDKSVRWWQVLALSLLGMYLAGTGVIYLQGWGMGRLSEPEITLASALSWLFTGLPVLIYYEWLVYRYQSHGNTAARWLIAWAVQGLGVLMTVAGLVQSLRWLFDLLGGERPAVPFGAPWLVAGALLWAYHHQVMLRNASRGEPLLTRLSVFGFSGLGVSLTTFGLIGVQEWLFSRFIGEPVFHLPDALAMLITGLPLWLYFWGWAGRLFTRGQPSEQKSDLRKAYLYLIIYIAVNGAVITIGLLLNGILRGLLGLPTSGSLGLSLSIIIASVALWAYHATVLHFDIRRAGQTSLQGGMQRLYWYLVAGVGLLAFLLGMAGTLSTVLRLIASLWEGGSFTVELREQLAVWLASLLAGLPVWASAWFPAQHAATRPDAVEMRRSLLRKAYLYFYLLGATLAVLVFSVTIVFQLLNALFGLFGGGNLLSDLGQSIGFAFIGAVLWGYHGWVLRGDGRFAKQEKEQVAEQVAARQAEDLQQLKARWASFRVAVVDPGNGRFGQTVIHELRREEPYLNLIGVGLTAEARAVLQSENPVATPDTDAPIIETEVTQLGDMSLIIAPWTAATPGGLVAQSKATKLIVPVAVEGMQWVGVPLTAATMPSLLQAVKQILQAQVVAAREVPATAA